LRRQIDRVRILHQRDLDDGHGRVFLPHALAEKHPEADRPLGWPYLLPSGWRAADPRTGIVRRHRPAESAPRKAVKPAVRAAGIVTHASCPTFRHRVATHRRRSGPDIRTIPEWLGHPDVRTPMIDTPVRKAGPLGVRGPIDGAGRRPPQGLLTERRMASSPRRLARDGPGPPIVGPDQWAMPTLT
jgi:Phage integrase family